MAEDRSERLYPARPLVGVGAVVWDGARVLLARRGKPPGEGTWSLPGGLIDAGESLVDAVRREVREECGIEVSVGPLVGVFEPIVRDDDGRVRFHYVVVDYLAYHEGGAVAAGDDAAELAWAAPDELADYNLNPKSLAMIERAVALARQGSR